MRLWKFTKRDSALWSIIPASRQKCGLSELHHRLLPQPEPLMPRRRSQEPRPPRPPPSTLPQRRDIITFALRCSPTPTRFHLHRLFLDLLSSTLPCVACPCLCRPFDLSTYPTSRASGILWAHPTKHQGSSASILLTRDLDPLGWALLPRLRLQR